MTRKDFVALAAALAAVRPPHPNTPEYRAWQQSVIAVANVCDQASTTFDMDRFCAAAYKEDA